jgi:hypothetical protein
MGKDSSDWRNFDKSIYDTFSKDEGFNEELSHQLKLTWREDDPDKESNDK